MGLLVGMEWQGPLQKGRMCCVDEPSVTHTISNSSPAMSEQLKLSSPNHEDKERLKMKKQKEPEDDLRPPSGMEDDLRPLSFFWQERKLKEEQPEDTSSCPTVSRNHLLQQTGCQLLLVMVGSVCSPF